MSKHNGQPPINPRGAGWPSTTGNPSGGGRGSNPPRKFQREVMKSAVRAKQTEIGKF